MNDTTPSAADDGASRGKLVAETGSRPGLPARREGYGPLAGYPADPMGAVNNAWGDFAHYWRIARKHRWMIASIVTGFVVLTAIVTLMTTPMYTATARLQIDRSGTKIVEGLNVEETNTPEFLKTQFEILKSRELAERAVVALQLASDESFRAVRTFPLLSAVQDMLLGPAAAKSAESIHAEVVMRVQEFTAVRPVAGSRLVDLDYSDPVPARAQRVVAALAEAFSASNIDKRFQANAHAKTFLDDQLKQLKVRLEDAEKKMLEFAEREQIVATNEKASTAETSLTAASTALGNLVSERIKSEQLWRQVEKSDAINLPQFLTNTVIDGLRAKRNALVTEYQEKLETFKPGYPAMIQIDNKIQEIDRQLSKEVRTIKDSLKASYESAVNQEREMRGRIETLKADLIDLQKRSVQYNFLKREADSTRELYNGLLQKFKEVDVAGGTGTNNIFVIERPLVPKSPSSPRLGRALVLALLTGMGVGLGAAFLIEQIDDRVHRPDELEQLLGLPALGVIPKAEIATTAADQLRDPRSVLSEAYRSLCTSLQFATESGLPRTLLVTSSGPAEGKSITSLAIAQHFASLGLRVLLIDADLRNPSIHKKLGIAGSPGLSNHLTGAATPPECFQSSHLAHLTIMPAGPLPPNPAELLMGARFTSLLSTGLQVFDLIVVDSPPVLGLADAPLLSSATAATILVASSGESRGGALVGAFRRLQQSRAAVVGTVLTKFDAVSEGYGYGYGYGYSYGQGQLSSDAAPADHHHDATQLPPARERHG